ncbi:hypothetical protein ACLIMP_16000 [Novosphingobium aerophilum]|uniref:hypothetical protein n=1 Tax=Novosphingobium TaxID=165696 RepID=UPI0006C84839|nr:MULTISPECIES: hypothetical protein [unclassified Novosphingobium]KPH65897.1 hypothetical protein ADT71_09615 [Novosphingobium sp. ST904]MPS70144.1 hypothetical protein [Novosphingobium sp.]TCM35257.1 hypothetical protein EDF59_11697 [Novosphingobium sp. ST904]WRT94878.1 hypothetical protein U9J33_21925 [Novosphingobium sp. RL4]
MGGEAEDISGEELLPLLHRKGGPALVHALIGSEFYHEDPEDLATILSLDLRTRAVRLQFSDCRSSSLPLTSGYILLTPELTSAIDALRTPEDHALEAARRKIAAFGFRTSIGQDDIPGLLAAIEAAHAYRLPWRDERFEGIRLTRKYGSAQLEAKLIAAWLEGAGDPPPGDLVIAMVSALRETGRTTDALAHTDLLIRKANGLDHTEQCILFVQRGALWLDRFEQTREPEHIERARQCARRSWAIEPGEECSSLFNRLRKLEG